MNHRSRYRRAFSTVPLLVIVALAGVAVLALRSNQTWNGVGLGTCESQVVAQLGEPLSTFSAGTVKNLRYADMELWLRSDRVYCITLHGDHDKLYVETCLRFGLPAGNWGDNTDWTYDDIVIRLFDRKLMILAN